MIQLSIRNTEFFVEDSSKEIFTWKHRAFFNISLGFEADETSNCYFYTRQSEFQDVISEIVAYLNYESMAFSVDIHVQKIISNIEAQENEFKEATQKAAEEITIGKSLLFQRDLKPYQLEGVEHFLKVKHGANFSVPGSGKTTMVYAYYEQLKQKGIVEKIFVVGPYSSFSPWEEESEKCFRQKLNSVRLVGTKRQLLYLSPTDTELFLCHYQTAANDRNEVIEFCRRYKVLFVIDESHYIKRFAGGVWADALLTIAPFAKRRVILSGTPMPNGYLDLWSQMTFLWPGKQVLGERSTYKAKCDDPAQEEEIRKEIRPFFSRVKKSDLKLPKTETKKIYYDLKPIQAQIYHALSLRTITELNLLPDDRQKLKQWRKAKMVRLLQAASNPSLLNRYSHEFAIPPLLAEGTSLIDLIEKYPKYEIPTKFEAAVNLTKNLISEGKKILLWTTFIHNINMLHEQLRDIKHFMIHGAIPKDDSENEINNREREIREFKSSTSPCVLIANPAACAESISLHKICHDAIYIDRTFNCGQFIQSLDRIHRIGLDEDEKVTYHILIANQTIDETIDDRLDNKHQTMIHLLEDEIPIGNLDIEGPELEDENEEAADFEATIKDLKNFAKEK